MQSIAIRTLMSSGPRPRDGPHPPRSNARPAPGPAASPGSLVGLGLYDFLAAIVTGRADVMTQVDFTRGGFEGTRTSLKPVVRATHVAPRRRLLVLLNGHVRKLLDTGPQRRNAPSRRIRACRRIRVNPQLYQRYMRRCWFDFHVLPADPSFRLVDATLQLPEPGEGPHGVAIRAGLGIRGRAVACRQVAGFVARQRRHGEDEFVLDEVGKPERSIGRDDLELRFGIVKSLGRLLVGHEQELAPVVHIDGHRPEAAHAGHLQRRANGEPEVGVLPALDATPPARSRLPVNLACIAGEQAAQSLEAGQRPGARERLASPGEPVDVDPRMLHAWFLPTG